ncbi:MAG: hypothetical protein ACLFQV_04360 [Vulcanimicrobiota bacterium]
MIRLTMTKLQKKGKNTGGMHPVFIIAMILFIILYLLLLLLLFGFAEHREIISYPGSRLRNCRNNLKEISNSIHLYATDHDGKYPESLNLLAPEYMEVLPACPSAEKDTCSSSYSVIGSEFTVFCSGHHHKKAGAPAGYPLYSTRKGLLQGR